ncbi:MAG: hypothetical protein ACP5GU_08975 [Thermoprotei archaeon]|jgi:cytochrome c oxidase subunit 2
MYIQQIIELIYGIYFFAILTFFIIFATKLTKPRQKSLDGGEHGGMGKEEKQWLVFLIIVFLVFNIVTLTLLPWQKWLLPWASAKPTKIFYITMNNYTFYLPSNPIIIKVNEPVEFIVTSKDVTYGFGVFRSDGTMVFQMQVIPWYNNSIIWIFDEPGNYTIRSTEYSGPEHPYMVLPNAIEVIP